MYGDQQQAYRYSVEKLSALVANHHDSVDAV